MEKSCRQHAQKAIPRSLVLFWQITQNIQEILLKVRYFERGSSKSLKKLKSIFSYEPSPF